MMLYDNALEVKKEISAHAYYLESLKKRALEHLLAYSVQMRSEGSPNIAVI